MRISTKALASLLLTTTVAGVVKGAERMRGYRRREVRFERTMQRHDRKGELRAEVIGVSPEEFRHLQRQTALPAIVRRYGFEDEFAFRRALLGKLRMELHYRGWTFHRIDRYAITRANRMGA